MPLNPFGEIDKVKMNPPRSLIVSPAGPTDPEVAILDIRTSRKKPLALLANYALHYVGATPRDQVSADYFGEFRRLMPSRIGRNTPTNFVALMSNGTSGDINNIDFHGKRAPRETFEQIRLVAAKVADAAWRARRDMKYESEVPVAMVQREIKLRWRKPTPDLIARAKKILAMSAEEKKKLPRLAENYASRTLSQADREGTADAVIQAIRIGDQAIVPCLSRSWWRLEWRSRKRAPSRTPSSWNSPMAPTATCPRPITRTRRLRNLARHQQSPEGRL